MILVDSSVWIDYFNGIKMSIRQNPVKENAIIDYAIQNNSDVKLVVWDVKGNEVAVINDGNKGKGQYSLNVDISKFKAGLYFCSLSTNGGRMTKKLVVE